MNVPVGFMSTEPTTSGSDDTFTTGTCGSPVALATSRTHEHVKPDTGNSSSNTAVLTYQCTHLSKPPAHTPHHDGRVSQPRPLTDHLLAVAAPRHAIGNIRATGNAVKHVVAKVSIRVE